jgi:hypothetical protein
VAHQHYKGTGQMHSFRGLLADGGQDKIRIEGATGEIAWRITKFQILTSAPGNASQETVVKIYREKQTTVPTSSATVDFVDNELLAAGIFIASGSIAAYSMITIFDNALFSRNIYVTNTDNNDSNSCNYYIELEEVKVSAAGMAQLAVAAARRT